MFYAFGPRLPDTDPPEVPADLAPFERFEIPRAQGRRRGHLAATWFPSGASGEPARGAVLLAHPWLEWGQAYFHRRGRIEALRAAGYHVLTFDLSGFGTSARPDDFWDLDVEDALEALRARAPGLPLGVWGISSGGYWAHMLLARSDAVSAAVFEDVAPHLLEWSWRSEPRGRPFYFAFRTLLRRAYAYLDLRRHAAHLKVRAVAYIGGGRDPGIPVEDHRRLAGLAGAESLIVPHATHLGAIKFANREVIELALETLARGFANGVSSP